MALAPFLDKITQSASSLLAGFDATKFTVYLSDQRVALAFDTPTSAEARVTLQLGLDLLARLYPAVDVIPLGSSSEDKALAITLLETARRINPHIEGAMSPVTGTASALVVGATRAPWDTARTPTIYVGSDGWIAKICSEHPVGSGESANPFGAGVAACIGAANVFRSVFGAHLKRNELDRRLALSLIDYELVSSPHPNPTLAAEIDLGDTYLLGVGAIGHGAVWAWRRTPGLRGTLHLIDDEDYEDTNPQRYVETVATGMPHRKVDHAAELLQDGVTNGLIVLPDPHSWDDHLNERRDWRLDRVVLALDTAEDRIFAQASLPRRIFNSWTQASNLGVSRHDFLTTACVSCLYLPTSEQPDLDDLVATALNFQGEQELRLVREYLDTERPVDRALLARIAQQVGLSGEALLSFEGVPLITLYHRAACGGTILQLGGQLGGETRQAEVPMAFQSALAGIMLAAEVVIDAAGLRSSRLPVRTEIDLLRPIAGTLCVPESKHPTNRCICQDQDFIDAYQAKYGVTPVAEHRVVNGSEAPSLSTN